VNETVVSPAAGAVKQLVEFIPMSEAISGSVVRLVVGGWKWTMPEAQKKIAPVRKCGDE